MMLVMNFQTFIILLLMKKAMKFNVLTFLFLAKNYMPMQLIKKVLIKHGFMILRLMMFYIVAMITKNLLRLKSVKQILKNYGKIPKIQNFSSLK